MLGVLVLALSFGVLSLPFGLVAWVLGAFGRRRLPSRPTSRQAGMASLAWWLGAVITVMSAIALVLLALDLTSLDGLLELGQDAQVDEAQ